MKDWKVVLSSMAYQSSKEKKPTEIFNENIALKEQNQKLKRQADRNGIGDVEESCEDTEASYEDHKVQAKVSLIFKILVNYSFSSLRTKNSEYF